MVRMMSNAVFQKRLLHSWPAHLFSAFGRPARPPSAFRRPLRPLPLLLAILLLAGPLFSAFPFQEAFSQTEEVDPFYLKLSKEGKYFFQNGKYDEAIKSFEIAFFGFIDNPRMILDCYVHLAVAHFKLKNVEKAKYYLEEINRQELWEHLAAAQLPKELLDEYTEISSRFSQPEARAQKQGDHQETPAPKEKPAPAAPPPSQKPPRRAASKPAADRTAPLKKLKQEIKTDPRNASLYCQLSAAYLEQGKTGEARSVLQDLLKLQPNNAGALFELGRIFSLEKKYSKALELYEKAAPSLEGNIDFLYETGKAYFELQDYAKARVQFSAVQSIQETYKETEAYLARLDEIGRVRKQRAERLLSEARAQKDRDKKTDLYLRALEQDSSNIDVYFELSGVLRDGKHYRQAAQAIDVLLEAGISDPRIPVELGTVHLLNKKYDLAITVLSEGRSSGNDSLELSYLLVKAYLGKKMYREAESELARLVEQSPDYRDSAALLEECRKKKK
jgi:tetratricopeptide (TPR) repeat protein